MIPLHELTAAVEWTRPRTEPV